MPKVKMIQCQAGSDFVRNPGDIVEVSKAEAARMIAADIAVPVREGAGETTKRARPASETTAKKRRQD